MLRTLGAQGSGQRPLTVALCHLDLRQVDDGDWVADETAQFVLGLLPLRDAAGGGNGDREAESFGGIVSRLWRLDTGASARSAALETDRA